MEGAPDGTVLLAGAIAYALNAATLVTPVTLTAATPCQGWNLGQLLRHLAASIEALDEALSAGSLATAEPPASNDDPVELLRDRAAGLLCTLFTPVPRCPGATIEVNGLPLPDAVVLGVGTLEIAVHGWDIYAACGRRQTIPAHLAGPLLASLPGLIPERAGLFAAPAAAPPCAAPGRRLVASLGRDHRWHPMVTGE